MVTPFSWAKLTISKSDLGSLARMITIHVKRSFLIIYLVLHILGNLECTLAFASILFHVVQNWLNFIELWLWTTAKCFSSLLHSNEIDYKRKTQINEAQWNAHVHAHYRNSKSSNKRICRVFYASYTLRTCTSYRHTKVSLCSL